MYIHGKTLELDVIEKLVEYRYYDRVDSLGIVTQSKSGTYTASVLRSVNKEINSIKDDGAWYYSSLLNNSIVKTPDEGFRIIEKVIEDIVSHQL